MTKVKESEATLAINGGEPVRTTPLPWELPGAYFIGEEELELVSKVVKAQSPFRFYGLNAQHMVQKVEEAFCKRWNRKHALGVSSGTSALRIALAAMDVGPGDEVLVPGYMWVSCIGAIVLQGAIPKLVDIDDTFCMSPDDLAAKIGPKTKAVLVVNMSGAPGHIEKIAKIAHDKGIKVLEDCAQACGASHFGKPAGSFGDIAIFSFQLNKNITSGEGGLILCDDDTLYKRCVAIHDLGYARNDEGRLSPNDENFQMWGFGCRLNELAGAMLYAQLGKLDKITGAMHKAKWKIQKALQEANIKGLEFRNIPDPEGDTGTFMITMYPSKEKCLEFTKALQAEGIKGPEGSLTCITMADWGLHWYYNNPSLVKKRSISSDGFPWTHPANEFGKSISYEKGTLPKCDEYAERGALLAIASTLSDKDCDDIIAAFKKVAAKVLA